MIRKFLTLILALTLAVVAPLSALADVQHTLSVKLGELLRTEEAISELLDVLDLRLTLGEESGNLSVLLNDSSIVNLGLTADTTGLYAGSNLFGDELLYVAWDDAFAFAGNMLVATMAESGVDEAMLEQMAAGLDEAKLGIIAAIGGENAVQPSAPASLEESIKIVEEAFPDDPAMTAYVTGLYENMVIEDGSFSDENRDTADQKYRMSMDEEALLPLCETNYLKTVITESLAAEMPDASEEELAKAADEAMLAVKKLFEESEMEMIMDMYTLDAGQTLVGLDMIMTMQMETADAQGRSQQTNMQMAGEYDRLTNNEGVSHKAAGAFAADGETVEASFELVRASDGVSKGMLGLLAGGEEIVVAYNGENTTADTRVRKADVYLRSGASAILPPAASDRPVISLEIVTEPAPAETLADLENADADSSINLLALTQGQLQELSNQISLKATQVLSDVLVQLPTSTLNLLMNSGMLW